MNFWKKSGQDPLIKNPRKPVPGRDFALNPIGLVLLVLALGASLVLRSLAGGPPGFLDLAVIAGLPAATILVMSVFPRWSVVLKLLVLAGVTAAALRVEPSLPYLGIAALGVLLAPAVQRLPEWERAIILRFGAFAGIRGPGLFFLFPFAEQAARVVDLRIRVTDFAAETTLTRDSVTVTVDALCFWIVWDPEKAVCEVQDYEEAVVLSSKTALRNAVSKNDLSTFLESGDRIEEQIRDEVDEKTTDWGITIQHIEITDIQIPESLQDSMSRLAQAEREKKGRELLAEAEIAIAGKLSEAAAIYRSDAIALKLRSLSILNEGLKAGNSMMLVPNSITEELRTDDLFGLQALGEARRGKARRKQREE
ncbi:MAG: slipin family protein [Spirochaetes bacterium]|nr:slipin family protein [Spirochaetota bacterium]